MAHVENFVHQPQDRPIRTCLSFALKPFGKERDKLVPLLAEGLEREGKTGPATMEMTS